LPSTPSSAPPEAPRRRLLLAAVAAAVVLLVGIATAVAVSGGGDSDAPERASDRHPCVPSVSGEGADVGDSAPTFELPGLRVGCVRSVAVEGAPTIVNFWASWCNPCRREFPRLQVAFDEHRAEGLEIIGVTYRDIESDAVAFADDQGADWLLLHDEDEIVAKAYGVNNIPQTFFIDDRGRITGRIFGALTRAELDEELAKIL
jgi:cytochrome c biogenesis protein CcmG/thiol:disulfide interchange protein DsbE